jgi:hypothetical protein
MPRAKMGRTVAAIRPSGGAPRVAARPASAQNAPLIASLMGATGMVEMDRVAASFGMSKLQLAETTGLGPQALYKTDRARAAKTQSRVKEMLEIVSRISTWAGGKERAMAWYRAQPIAAFGGRTAESLVKSGKASALRDYLDHIAMGGFA